MELYKVCKNGTKLNIELFQNELIESIKFLYYYDGNKMSQKDKLEFFRKLRQTYGGHALCLSGGAGLGKFHYGVIKALWECDLLPQIICGTSVGSAIAANICMFKREEIPLLFYHEVSHYHGIVQPKFKDKYELIYKIVSQNDVIFQSDQIKTWARNHLEDLTFKELYDKNGWILNIGVTDEKMST